VNLPSKAAVAEDRSAQWRAELVTRFGWAGLAGGMPVLCYYLYFFSYRTVVVIAMLAAVAAAAAAVLLKRIDSRSRELLVVLPWVLVGTVLARFAGPSPGMFLSFTLASVLAAVVWGGRGGIVVLAVSATCLLVFGNTGRFETTGRWVYELPQSATWVRMSVGFSLLTGLIVLLVSSAVRRVERSLAETKASLNEAVRERQARAVAEEALRAHEERLRLALEAAGMGTWEWNIETGDVTWAGELEKLFGLPSGSFRGSLLAFKEAVHPDDWAEVDRGITQALSTESSEYRSEYRVRGGDPVRWLEGRGRVYRDSTGRPLLMRGTAADITARKAADEALRRSEAELRALFASMEDVILVLDRDGRYVRIAPTSPSLLYLPPEELLGRRLHHVFPSERADFFLRQIHRCLDTRRTLQFEYSLPIAGKPTWFAATVSPMLEDQVVWVARDVTERRRASEALRESEERWRRISEATSEGIAFTDQGVMFDVSEQLTAMLGYSPGELYGMAIEEWVVPEFQARVAGAMRIGASGVLEFAAVRKDGTSFPVELRARCLTLEGRPIGVAAIRDVSERSRLEAELRRRERLAGMGSLVAAVAHEVRTPLFSLSATLDTLEAGVGTPVQQQELRELLRSQVRRLSNLMQDLLDYGRPPTLRLVPDRILTAVLRAVESCRPQAAQADVELKIDISEGLPAVLSDAGRLQQVFENLIGNALQHSPRGSKVTVGAAAVTGPPPGLACRVEDQGAGVAADDLERLFEPFFSRRKGGTGMGLAIAQRFVEAHGGTLTAANRPEGGAIFTVFLPALDAAGVGHAVA
jgi:PAS domain S-box-containing protein